MNEPVDRPALDAQKGNWETMLTERSEMFGLEPSYPASEALAMFKEAGTERVLELGGGQGRDTLFFARNGLGVHVLDYTRAGADSIEQAARVLGIEELVDTAVHDVREPLPVEDGSYDACFSHMLYRMALTTEELRAISKEIWRVLKPGGINVYTARHTGDPDYGLGIHVGEDMYEDEGVVVHFLSREKVERLAAGYQIIEIEEFEEGPTPRKLFMVTSRKQAQGDLD